MNTILPAENSKKSFLNKILTNLTFWVLIAIMVGVYLGHYFPENAVEMKIVGDSFIELVKIFIAPIIFLTIVLGISSMGDLKKVGRIGFKSLMYFEIFKPDLSIFPGSIK